MRGLSVRDRAVRSMGRRGAAALLVALAVPAAAGAQRRAGPEAEARAHFRRGVARTDEGAYDAAMAEFNAAWELTRDPRILYNVAMTHEARGDAASALTALDRFAREAPARAVAALRREVDAARARLGARVATVAVAIDVPGLEVRVDGAPVEPAAARAGVVVNAGRRRVALVAPGWQPLERAVDLAAGAREVIREAMRPVTSTVAVECDVPDAEVWIDGARAGVTPLDAPAVVPEGAHTVEVRRPGYTAFSRAVEARGVGARVRAELGWASLDGATGARLVVRATEPAAAVTLDGRPIPADGSALVPPGRHRLAVSTERFVPAAREVTLTAGATREERVALAPTPAFRAEYLADASRARRTAAWVFWPGVVGAVLGASAVAAGVALAADADARWGEADLRRQQCKATGACDATLARAARDEAEADGDRYRAVAVAGGVLVGVGVGAAVVGEVLRRQAPRLDRFPAVAVRAGAGGAWLGVAGSF